MIIIRKINSVRFVGFTQNPLACVYGVVHERYYYFSSLAGFRLIYRIDFRSGFTKRAPFVFALRADDVRSRPPLALQTLMWRWLGIPRVLFRRYRSDRKTPLLLAIALRPPPSTGQADRGRSTADFALVPSVIAVVARPSHRRRAPNEVERTRLVYIPTAFYRNILPRYDSEWINTTVIIFKSDQYDCYNI